MLESNGLLSPISTELSLPSSVFTETTRFGRSSPYCVGSASLSSLFCLKSATPFTTASTVDASVSAATGSTIFHGAEASARVTSATSFPPLTSLTWRTLALSSSSNSFADFSFCSAFFSVSRVTQRAAPPIAAASARTPSVVTSDFVVCFMAGLPGLAGLPDEQAREEQRERQQVEGEQRHLVLLLGGEEQVVPAAAPGPDGDLRLLVRHPARRVQREVAVPAQLVEPVGGEVRVADHHHARFRVPRSVGRGDRERDRALQVLARRVLHPAVADGVRLAPGARAGPRQLDHAPTRRGILHLRDAAGEREDAGHLERRAARVRDRVVGILLRDRELRLLRLGVDHLVVAQLQAPRREGLLQAGVDAGIDQGDELPALVHPFLHELRLSLGERGHRSGEDQRLRVGRHRLGGSQLDLGDLVALGLEPVDPELHAALGGVADAVLAVSLAEVDLLGGAPRDLGDGVGERLLAHVLGARLL